MIESLQETEDRFPTIKKVMATMYTFTCREGDAVPDGCGHCMKGLEQWEDERGYQFVFLCSTPECRAAAALGSRLNEKGGRAWNYIPEDKRDIWTRIYL